MLQLQNIELQLGDRILLNGISALINPGERVGLTGPNGAGKSTLLKMIAGEMEPDSGEIVLGNGATVGYLPQDGVEPDPSCTVIEEVERGFSDIIAMRNEMETVRQQMESHDADSPEGREALQRFGILQDRMETSRAYTLTSDIERVLSGLGFNEKDFSRPTTEFSGGWLMRIALARLLLRRPTYLLLDEPTNHLDIESLRWMESFLADYDGAVIVVSHDRAFLDALTTRTLALSGGRMRDYAGNYTYYERKWAEEKELLQRQYENQQKEIKQTQEFIDRFRYKASKAKQVQSRIKMLEKMERVEIPDDQDEISFRFPQPERSGRVVMKLAGAVKRYGDHTVFDGLDYQVERGQKIAVVGPNGAGKSTLIRMLAGVETLSGGERIPGHNVTLTWFAQHQADELEPSATILETLQKHAPQVGETQIRSLLGCFLFTGEDVFKKIRVLSGGEKSRVALARMLITPANFIILDEPTNHLDMKSKRILQHALEQYEGTCMIVSHDRAFIDPIVNRTLEIRPGEINEWPGTVSDYLERRQRIEEDGGAGSVSGRSPSGTKSGNDAVKSAESGEESNGRRLSKKELRQQRARERKAREKSIRPLEKRLRKVEKEVAEMESRREEIESLMAAPDFYDDPERVRETSIEYESLKSELGDAYRKWEELAGRIEHLEEQLET